MTEEIKLKWFERDGPYRLKFSQGRDYTIIGPDALDGHGPTETPRRFEQMEAQSLCYWMNGAYAHGLRTSIAANLGVEVATLRASLKTAHAHRDHLGSMCDDLTLALAEIRELEEMLGDSLVRADRAENKAVGMAIKIRYALQDAEWQYERALDTKNTNDLSHWGGRIAQYEEFFKGLRDEERKADVARATLAALAAATPPQQER